MRKAIVSVLLAVALAVQVQAADWSRVVASAAKSIVYIESKDGACTGFVIDAVRKHVMTAAHCVGDDIWFDGVSGNLVFKDTKGDLAVYHVEHLDPAKTALVLALKDPKVGQEVMSVGYGMALATPLFRRAMVSDTQFTIPQQNIGGPYIALDATYVGGQSGGPVLNSLGQVVSIVQMGTREIGFGLGANRIREKTARFWSK